MSSKDFDERKIIEEKIEETWSILKEIEEALTRESDIINSDKELVLIKKFEFALTDVYSDRLLIIEDESQGLQCVNFKGTETLEMYNFQVGKTIYFVHMDKKKKLIHHGEYDYEVKYWHEAIPARIQILDLSKDGDTVSVEFLFDRDKLRRKGMCTKDEDSPEIDLIPRVIGKIDIASITEWLIYLYNWDVINDNIGIELRNLCETDEISGLDAYLERLCEVFSSYFERFVEKPGNWLKIYLLLYANLSNNLLVVTDDPNDVPQEDFVLDDFIESS